MPRGIKAMCCFKPQCCLSQLHVECPAPNRPQTPVESIRDIPSSAAPARTSEPHPPPAPPPKCDTCLYRACGCQVSPASDKDDSNIDSLDIDINDPQLILALNNGMYFKNGAESNYLNAANLTVADRFNNVDFVTSFFQNYQKVDKQADDSGLIQEAVVAGKDNEQTLYSPLAEFGLISDAEVINTEKERILDSPADQMMSSESSLPSSFQMEGFQRQMLVPTNSPVSWALPLTTESDGSSTVPWKHKVSVELQRKFSSKLGCIINDLISSRENSSAGKASPSYKVMLHSRTPCSSRRRVKRHSLGNRPPCIGQEQSPIRGSPCVGQEETPVCQTLPPPAALRLVALTPEDPDQNLVLTPRGTYTSPAVSTLPTVKRDLRFALRPTQNFSENEMAVFKTPAPVAKSSTEKVRSWLDRLQSSRQRFTKSQPPSSSDSGSSSWTSLRISPLFHKRRAKRRCLPQHRNYKHLVAQDAPDKPEPSEKHSDNFAMTSTDDNSSLPTEDLPPSLRTDELSSSGFLADRSSTTTSNQNILSDYDQERMSWSGRPPCRDIARELVADFESLNDRSEPSSSSVDCRIAGDSSAYAAHDETVLELFDPQEHNDLQSIVEEEDSTHDSSESTGRESCNSKTRGTKRRHVLVKDIKGLGRHLQSKSLKDSCIKTLAIL